MEDTVKAVLMKLRIEEYVTVDSKRKRFLKQDLLFTPHQKIQNQCRP
jgi:hypothetical protein